MRTNPWSLALCALVLSGSIVGCKSSSRHPMVVGDGGGGMPDGGTADAGEGGTIALPGILVTPTANLQTTEDGGQATFKVSLATKPTADVKIGVTSSAPDEGTVSSALLTFTVDNWASQQTVTVTGVNDDEQDGTVAYKVLLAAAQSTDVGYNGKKASDVDVSNLDNDTAGVQLIGATGLHTSEPDTTATFQVKLTTKPTAVVTIPLSSSDAGEVTVTPATLTFTPDNWSGLQTVTLQGVDDAEVDGPQTVNIITGTPMSADARYAAIAVDDVSVINDDNDSVSFTVRPTSGLMTHENGGQASFTIRLNQPPSQPVTVGLSSSDATEVSIAGASTLTFTPDNWRSPHTVIVQGVNDSDPDGNQNFTIVTAPSVSADARFNGINAADVTGVNTDDDTPGVTVVAAANLEVSENGGQATFTVVLNKAPSADVTIPVSSSNTDKARVSASSLVFTANNWNAPRTVTITGVNNAIKDGRQPVNIVLAAATSTDTGYAGIDPTDVTVFVIDDDGPGLSIVTAADFTTNEQGKQTTFTVRLNSKPAATVSIPLLSDDTGEIIVSPATLTFTVDDWNSPHVATLTGVNDNLLDGPQEVDVRIGPTTSSDPEYLNIAQQRLTATNIDDDTAGVFVTPTAGLLTSEAGGQDTFSVVLNHAPTANVSFTLSVSRTDEASIAPTTLTFTPVNWASPQVVTLTGLNDTVPVADGRQSYWVAFTPAVSTDPEYSGMVVPNVLAANNDDDTPGVTTTPLAGNMTTSEAGTQATFNVVLDSRPTADVVLSVVSSDLGEGTVDVSSLTFTVANWNAPQRVTVTGVNDDIDDATQVYPILIGPATSTDTTYNGLVVANPNISNTDDDTAGVTVAPLTTLITSEASTQATFTVVLRSEPTATVTIPISSSKPGEATVSPTQLTFTPGASGNWAAPQTVTVTGQGDLLPDGNQSYNVVFGAIASADATYAALTVPNLDGTNIDNDSANITVIGNNLLTGENGDQDSFTITLGAPPAADVIVPITISKPGEALFDANNMPTLNVTFTPVNYGALRVITIEGVNDAIADGNQPYRISIGPAVSADPTYAGRSVPDLDASNTDDDTAGITVVAAEPLRTDEFGGLGATPSFTVRLTSQPTANVTIPIASSDIGEGTVSPASLTFTAGNWNAVQTVTLTGVNDDVADGSQPYFAVVGPATSSDANYNNRSVPNVSAFNTDNDSPGLTVVAAPTLNTTEGGGTSTFTLRLTSQPTADVTITVASTNPAEGSVDNGTLTFTALTWSTVQTVTVRGVNDDVDDGDQPYQFSIAATSTDPNYVRSVPNLDALNADNDSAGFTIVGAGALSVSEPNGSTTFTIRLRSQPTQPVTIPLGVNDATEIAVAPAQLVFTAATWADPQTVTVTSVNDDVADGTATPRIQFGTIDSADPNYAALNITDINVTNLDDDSALVLISKLTVSTFEVGTTDTFTVALNSEPSATTTIVLASSDITEATVSPGSLVFTAVNWATPQTVTVSGIQDAPIALDGDQNYDITLASPTGAAEYAVLPVRTVTGINYQAFLDCKELLTLHPAAPSGVYFLDSDRTGSVPEFRAYCDQVSDGGGWTLLSWTADSAVTKGPPYPGLAYCSSTTFNCVRGSGVPSIAAVTPLFASATELGQGQGITTGSLKTTFSQLKDYEFAGSFSYPSLANLTISSGPEACAPLVTGVYNTISDTTQPNRNDGTTVFLSQSLRVTDSLGDYSSDPGNYAWSIGNRTGYCVTNGTPPASVVGTWQPTQYGPAFQNASGSYSIWLR
jgi:hypothetical protein